MTTKQQIQTKAPLLSLDWWTVIAALTAALVIKSGLVSNIPW